MVELRFGRNDIGMKEGRNGQLRFGRNGIGMKEGRYGRGKVQKEWEI